MTRIGERRSPSSGPRGFTASFHVLEEWHCTRFLGYNLFAMRGNAESDISDFPPSPCEPAYDCTNALYPKQSELTLLSRLG